jgi:hypothetical protein
MAKKTKKHKGGGRWIQELQTDDIVQEKPGTFSEENTAEEIANELKRKAPDFQAAMGKLTLFMNRAGKRLSESRKKELNRVKDLLRDMYGRKDRELAQKKSSVNKAKTASQWATWFEEDDDRHVGDQYLELLLADPGKARSVHPEVNWKTLQEYKRWLLDLFENEIPYPDPETKEEEEKDFEIIKKKMSERIQKGRDVPILEVDPSGNPIEPVVVPKVACVERQIGGERELIFSSEVDAIQFLADMIKEKIIIKS